MRGFVVAIVGLGVLLPACTGSGSGTLNPTASTTWHSQPLPQVVAQPLSCPRQWTFSPVDGSDVSMVPGDPVAAVTCSGHRRYVHSGSQLTQLVNLLNSRRHLDANDCPNPNIGGLVLTPTQMYFDYPSGDIQLVSFNPNCRTVSNGELTARFGQATT